MPSKKSSPSKPRVPRPKPVAPRVKAVQAALADVKKIPELLALTDEAARCLELYRQGERLRDIAKVLSRSVVWCHATVVEALIVRDNSERKALREIELAKLDESEQRVLALREQFHPKIVNGVVAALPVYREDGSPHMIPELDRWGNEVFEVSGAQKFVQKTVWVEDAGVTLACEDMLLKIRRRRADLLGLDQALRTGFLGPDGEPLPPSAVPVAFNISFVEAPGETLEGTAVEKTREPSEQG